MGTWCADGKRSTNFKFEVFKSAFKLRHSNLLVGSHGAKTPCHRLCYCVEEERTPTKNLLSNSACTLSITRRSRKWNLKILVAMRVRFGRLTGSPRKTNHRFDVPTFSMEI